MRTIERYDGRVIDDDGSVNSAMFKEFAKTLKSDINHFDGYQLRKYSVGHYEVSGFVERLKDRTLFYFSFGVPRGGEPLNAEESNAFYGLLLRKAKTTNDFHGETNHFTSLRNFHEAMDQLN